MIDRIAILKTVDLGRLPCPKCGRAIEVYDIGWAEGCPAPFWDDNGVTAYAAWTCPGCGDSGVAELIMEVSRASVAGRKEGVLYIAERSAAKRAPAKRKTQTKKPATKRKTTKGARR